MQTKFDRAILLRPTSWGSLFARGRRFSYCAPRALALLFLASTSASRAQFSYEVNGPGWTIDGYFGSDTVVTIPSTAYGNPVTGIKGGFFGNTNLSSITIPSSVTNISAGTFSGCTTLTNLTVDTLNPAYRSVDGVLFNQDQTTMVAYPGGKKGGYVVPSSVLRIESDTFEGCDALTSIAIAGAVAQIGDWAFAHCTSLANITVPDSVISIGAGAFSECTALTSIAIGKGVISISNLPLTFEDCIALTNLTVNNLNPSYSSLDGVLFDKSQSVLLRYPPGKGGDYIVPDSVTSFTEPAFSQCKALTSVTIGKDMTSIGGGTFDGCIALTNVTVNSLNPSYSSLDGVLFTKNMIVLMIFPPAKGGNYVVPDTVGNLAGFGYCTALTSITIGKGVTIGSAFHDCIALTNIVVDPLNPNCSSLDGVLFDKHQFRLLEYPRGKGGAYIVPNGVTFIASEAFFGCAGLTNVVIPDSVTSIGDSAFADCAALASITIGAGVRVLDSGIFSGCTGLTSVTLGEGLTTIVGDFSGCTALTGLTIPGSVTNLDAAYGGFAAFSNIVVAASSPAFSSLDGVIFNKNQDALLRCLIGKVGSYVVPGSVTSIGSGAFSGCIGLTNITMFNNVTNIGGAAFEGCSGLTGVTIGKGVTRVDEWTFGDCTGLTSITIPAGLTTIEGYAFMGCSGLTRFFFQGNAPSIPPCCFGVGNATVYYLSGAAGWDSPFHGLPTVLWNPLIQVGNSSFGLQAGGSGLNITGTPNIPLVVEAASNLSTGGWVPLKTLTLTNGLVHFSDSDWTNHPARFYRLRAP